MTQNSRWGFLGPSGTFTESAMRSVNPDGTATAFPSVPKALKALGDEVIDSLVLPLEGSAEGGLNATFESLIGDQEVIITKEVLLPISFVLAVQPGVSVEEVTTVASHPHAQAQCRAWFEDWMPEVDFVATSSTASAAASLSRRSADHNHVAALCAPAAAAHYSLDIAMAGITDTPGATTRFVVLGRPTAPPPATGADKTTIVVFQQEDSPGGLLEVLEVFSTRRINLTRIESRHSGTNGSSVCFALDIQSHVNEPRLAHALMALYRTGRRISFLGSYPSSNPVPVEVPEGHRAQDYESAQEWFHQVTRQNS